MRPTNADNSVNDDRSRALDVRAAAFDRLGVSAAVLDSNDVIVDTNQAWRLFAHLNDGPIGTTGAGVNYLDVRDRASAAGVLAHSLGVTATCCCSRRTQTMATLRESSAEA